MRARVLLGEGQRGEVAKSLGTLDRDVPASGGTSLFQVFCNLIKNAWEAMPNGGILTLNTELVEEQVVIRIADTGIGIPAEILSRVFEPFVTHGKSHGTGLGMAIAKSIVSAHEGEISIASVLGKGTTVEIRLPLPTGED